MWFYIAILLLPPVLIAIWIWVCRRKGKVQVRWWAWPVLLASIPLSFPAHLTQAISDAVAWFPTMTHGYESTCLAPWISNVLYCCHWPQLLTWVLGLFIVLRWKGVAFASPKTKDFFLGSVGVVMVPLCLFDALLLAFLFFLTPLSSSVVAESVSPDGRLLVRAYENTGMCDATYGVVCETNDWCPLIATKLDTLGEFLPLTNLRFVWSKDSRVVELCHGNNPLSAYALPRRIKLKSPGVPIFTERIEIDRLMAEHGGPSP